MRCPRDGSRCGEYKYKSVRRCPGCRLWQQAREERQERWRQMREEAQRAALPQPPQYLQPPPESNNQPDVTLLPSGRQPAKPHTSGARYVESGYESGRGVMPGHSLRSSAGRSHASDSSASASHAAVVGVTPDPGDVLYLYDGSLAGLYCCVHESFYLREMPTSIRPEGVAQPTLLHSKTIYTDQSIAKRVENSIADKIAGDALDLVETVFLSCLEQKELHILRFLYLAYKQGAKVLQMLGHPDVAPLLKAEKHLLREAHLLQGFVRFSDYDGVLASRITPKNFILPFLAGHFRSRYSEEKFIIYDARHKAALIYQNHHSEIIALEEMPFPQANEAEERYRALWKNFYHTIAIEARDNPRCRMTHLPKRYWENMTEMRELL